MATADSVKTKIQGLIDVANAATGKTDTDLTAAIGALVAGFGGGDGGGVTAVARGSVTPVSELNFNSRMLTIEHGLGVRPRVIIMYAECLVTPTNSYSLRYMAYFREVINETDKYSIAYSRISSSGDSFNEYHFPRKDVPEYCGNDIANWNDQTVAINPANAILKSGITYHWVVIG